MKSTGEIYIYIRMYIAVLSLKCKSMEYRAEISALKLIIFLGN